MLWEAQVHRAHRLRSAGRGVHRESSGAREHVEDPGPTRHRPDPGTVVALVEEVARLLSPHDVGGEHQAMLAEGHRTFDVGTRHRHPVGQPTGLTGGHRSRQPEHDRGRFEQPRHHVDQRGEVGEPRGAVHLHDEDRARIDRRPGRASRRSRRGRRGTRRCPPLGQFGTDRDAAEQRSRQKSLSIVRGDPWWSTLIRMGEPGSHRPTAMKRRSSSNTTARSPAVPPLSGFTERIDRRTPTGDRRGSGGRRRA